MKIILVLMLLLNALFMLLAFLIQEIFKVFLFNKVSPEKASINIKNLFDPIGIILMAIFNVGWINPTELNFFLVENRKKNIVLVYSLPVILNLLIGILFLFICNFFNVNSIIFTISTLIYNSNFAVFALSFIPFHTMAFYRIYITLASPTTRMKLISSNSIITLIFAFLIFAGIISIYINFISNILINLFSIIFQVIL